MAVSWKLKERAIRALEQDGVIHTIDLINAARDPTHPCHADFTWDIAKAAQERWHDQARALIRRVSFDLQIGEITFGVVNYVPGADVSGAVFVSVPKLRGKAATRAMMAAEIAQVHGVMSRICGLALAKERILGAGLVSQLDDIRNRLAALKENLS